MPVGKERILDRGLKLLVRMLYQDSRDREMRKELILERGLKRDKSGSIGLDCGGW
jgi:hypothetical protein